MVSLAHKDIDFSLGLAFNQQEMRLSHFFLIDLGLVDKEGIDHFLQSLLLDLSGHIICIISMSVGLLPHRVSKQKSHIVFDFLYE